VPAVDPRAEARGALLVATVSGLVVLFAFSIAALKGGLLPRWLAWLGLVFACSGTLGIVGIATGVGLLYGFWFGGLFGFVLWILLVSAMFALRWWRSRPAPAATA